MWASNAMKSRRDEGWERRPWETGRDRTPSFPPAGPVRRCRGRPRDSTHAAPPPLRRCRQPKLRHGGRELCIRQPARLQFSLVGQPAGIAMLRSMIAMLPVCADSREGADRSVDVEAHQFHSRLQLMA